MTAKQRTRLEIYTSVRQRNQPLLGNEKSIAEEIKIIKDKGASCSTCSFFCTKRFITFCSKKNKAIKAYNICTEHSNRKELLNEKALA